MRADKMNKADRLAKVLGKPSRRIIGLMSGMSMDGVDLACADTSGIFPDLEVKLLGTHYKPYTRNFRDRLQAATTLDEISRLNVLVAQEFAQCVLEFLNGGSIPIDSIDAIGSHGQTIFHSTGEAELVPSTLQIGSPSIIAERTGIITVGNFRVRDIAAGGLGAPLVSIADYALFRDPNGPVALNNLGSISNLTIVTPEIEGMMAFDTGPANMPIDYFAKLLPNNQSGFDADGIASSKGRCIQPLLEKLLQEPFFRQPPPKAAGYAEFGPDRLAKISKPFLGQRPEDLLRTAVDFSAITIAQAYEDFVLPRYPNFKKIIFSGGGTYNKTLMRRIQDLLPGLTVEIMEKALSDAKEALAFALLANETLAGQAGSFHSTTGIKRSTALGEIAL